MPRDRGPSPRDGGRVRVRRGRAGRHRACRAPHGPAYRGPLAAFKADALELADYTVLQPRNDVDLNVANRGVTITGNACFTVPEGVTLTVSNDITYNGALKKKGPGVLALNGNARAGGETASLTVAEGFLRDSFASVPPTP